MYMAEGLRACTSSMNFFSVLSYVLEFLKFLIQLKLTLRVFVVAAVVFSLYIPLDPLKTPTKPETPFYWVLLKYSPVSQ